jgi:hypothetical protein
MVSTTNGAAVFLRLEGATLGDGTHALTLWVKSGGTAFAQFDLGDSPARTIVQGQDAGEWTEVTVEAESPRGATWLDMSFYGSTDYLISDIRILYQREIVNSGTAIQTDTISTTGLSCGTIAIQNSIFNGDIPASLESYPYTLVPLMKRYRMENIPSGDIGSITLEAGFGQAMAKQNSLNGGIYSISVMEENSDYGLNPPWAGVWYVELSSGNNNDIIRLIGTVVENNLTASVTQDTLQFNLRNDNNQNGTGVLIVTQMQVG